MLQIAHRSDGSDLWPLHRNHILDAITALFLLGHILMCPNNEFTVTRRSLLAFLMPQWHSMTFLITPMFLTGLCVTGWSLLANHMVSFISNETHKKSADKKFKANS